MRLNGEFQNNVLFGRFIMVNAIGAGGADTLYAPFVSFPLQPHSRELINDTSGDAVEATCLATGRIDFDMTYRTTNGRT